jgi:hypothetical protein
VPRSPFLLILLAALAATPATAGLRPYVRVGVGISQLQMATLNEVMLADQDAIRAAGGQADFDRIKAALGPEASAGLWLHPAFRLGGTFAWQRSRTENRVEDPGTFTYKDQYTIDITEVGGEAAVRIARFSGLTFGGQLALTWVEVSNQYTVENPTGSLHAGTFADQTDPTWGLYMGLDQTNERGMAGFIRVGYRFRDLGPIPGHQTVNDGSSVTTRPVTTLPLDFSGWYASVGFGFD